MLKLCNWRRKFAAARDPDMRLALKAVLARMPACLKRYRVRDKQTDFDPTLAPEAGRTQFGQ